LLRLHDKQTTEEQIARESYTSRTGTENWYLARTLRGRGLDVQFLLLKPNEPWPFPAIAGVRLSSAGNSGHFVAVLGHEGDNYILGDPLDGKVVLSRSAFEKIYSFTGFFMTVK
jgi:ABC-type bacteriocin/lantibiotic exporter with double-glycine peptidase domain